MRRAFITGIFLAVAACAVAPRYQGPPAVAANPGWTEVASTAALDPEWWRSLGDPVLTSLVEAALERNLDLRTAAVQVREARANRDAAFGPRLPQVDFTGGASRNELSANGELPINRIPGFSRRFNLFDSGFDASWELDFWQANARRVEAADARVESATEALHNVQIQTVAEVVRTYVALRSAQARLASTGQDAEARKQTAVLAGARFQAGEASRSDEAQALQQSFSTQSEIPGLSADARAAAYSLALLTARPPEAVVALAEQPVALPVDLPEAGIGLRSELLRRRPDVRQAEREVAAATADVAASTADLFPRITLIASAGQQSLGTGNFFGAGSSRYQLGPTLSWPIFSAGRIRAQIRAAGARADAVAARYEKAVLGALSDSETSINRYAAAGAQRRDMESSRQQAGQALSLARRRYEAGEDDLLVLLRAQSDYSGAEQAELTARAAELTALVSLYKALGGGWERTDVRRTGAAAP
ncbi:MAG: efflux transporter outer membrane subunit [Steroidobacterales bacterium]